jgi:predicted phosphoribosyltransferase
MCPRLLEATQETCRDLSGNEVGEMAHQLPLPTRAFLDFSDGDRFRRDIHYFRSCAMFRDRQDAAYQLVSRLEGIPLKNPLVLAIPRGGVVLGAVMARELGADLDVVLARKLRCPGQPELAIGAVAEDGSVYLNPEARHLSGQIPEYIAQERDYQVAEIARRMRLIRAVCPASEVQGRSVIVTDDGLATGSTMIAALQVLRSQSPHEIIVALPVAAPSRLQPVRRLCHRLICLLTPEDFWAIGEFYEDFSPVEDDEVVRLLKDFAPTACKK